MTFFYAKNTSLVLSFRFGIDEVPNWAKGSFTHERCLPKKRKKSYGHMKVIDKYFVVGDKLRYGFFGDHLVKNIKTGKLSIMSHVSFMKTFSCVGDDGAVENLSSCCITNIILNIKSCAEKSVIMSKIFECNSCKKSFRLQHAQYLVEVFKGKLGIEDNEWVVNNEP